MCARLKQVDACTYRARFTGTFLKVIPFTYSVPLQVAGQGADGSVWLTGQSRLPIFGEFTTQARVDACGVQAIPRTPTETISQKGILEMSCRNCSRRSFHEERRSRKVTFMAT